MGGVFHLDLETITLETDLVELDGLQHTALVTHKTSGGIVNAETGDDLHVYRGKVTHQYTTYGPVYDVDTFHIARTDRQIVALIMTGCIESRQVAGGVAEVGIHLEDVVVVVLQCPLKAGDIGCAQTELALTLDDKQPVAEFHRHQSPDNGSCAVRRTVVDDKYMETLV